jgi:hypothetical protein
MRWSWGLGLLALFIGCGEGGPPLDELPLRDALRAEPEVVAGLPPAAKAGLAGRLEAARLSDVTTDHLENEAASSAALITLLDRTRERRLAGPLMVGAIADGLARPVLDRVATGDTSMAPLPVLEGESAVATAALESRALDGEAGASVRALMTASGARRLSRVVGWPIGAIAIGDIVFVNASWLVALAPGDGDGPDAGLGGPPPSERAATGTGSPASGRIAPSVADGGVSSGADAGELSPAVDAGEQMSPPNLYPIADAGGGEAVDGGRPTPPAPTPPAPTPPPPIPPPPTPPPPTTTVDPSFWDACGAGADSCGAAGDSCDTTTDDGSDDSCSGTTDDGSDDSCTTPPDDGGGCQVAHGGRRAHVGTLLWLLAPLGFLLGRRP